MRKLLLVTVAALALASTALAAAIYWKSQQTLHETTRVLKQAVAKDFHDPESARFRAVQLQSLEGAINERMELIDAKFLWRSTLDEVLSVFRYDPEFFELCGEVNAKNGFGAYVGYNHFYVSGGKDPVLFIDARDNDDFAKKMCHIGKIGVVFSEREPEPE
jgi:opacity protein-like surface antigen